MKSSNLLRYLYTRRFKEKFSDAIESIIDSFGSRERLIPPHLSQKTTPQKIPYEHDTTHKSYFVKSPWPSVKIPPSNLLISDFMFTAFEKYRDRVALIDSLTHVSMTFGDLIGKSKRIAGSLSLRDISHGHRVTIVTQNLPDFLPVFLALNALGAVVSLISPLSTVEELKGYFNETKAQTVFAQYNLLPNVRAALLYVPSFKQDHLFCMEPLHEPYQFYLCETQKSTYMANAASKYANKYSAESKITHLCPKILTVSDLCHENAFFYKSSNRLKKPRKFSQSTNNEEGVSEDHISTDTLADEVAIIPFSSGTTGKPKGVLLTNQNILANIVQCEKVMDDKTPKIVSGLLPFYHIYGFTVNLLNTLAMGNTVVTFASLEPNIYLHGIEKFKVSFLFVVPTVAQFLLSYKHLHKYDLSSVKTIFNGASRLPLAQAKKIRLKFKQPLQIAQGYGMTEMSPVSHCMPLHEEYTESIGYAIPNTQCKIVDINTQETLPPNTKGELCIKGPQIMLGYLNNPQATTDMIRDGWLHTGDIGYYNTNGAFYITDRLKELIKYKGFQVAPAEVESYLLTNRDILDVAVIGVPDDKVGELPTAFIVSKPSITAKHINDMMAAKLSNHKWLRGGIHFVDNIPRSAAGKILRNDLKRIASDTSLHTKYFRYNENC